MRELVFALDYAPGTNAVADILAANVRQATENGAYRGLENQVVPSE